MDRLTSSSHIARPEPNANSEIYSDSVVIATKEKSISNKNKISINIIYSHKPAAEVFNNPELLSAAKLARSEIKNNYSTLVGCLKASLKRYWITRNTAQLIHLSMGKSLKKF